MKTYIYRITILFSVLLLTACAGPGVYQVELIPSPDVYAEGMVNPFPDKNPLENAPYHGILYATDRLPAEKTIFTPEERSDEAYYKNKRGLQLRLGTGRIEIDKRIFIKNKTLSWDELKKISTSKKRKLSYPLQIKDIEEIGILDRSYNIFNTEEELAKKTAEPGKKFSSLINKKLKISKRKDIYIYVHGYNTVFEDPLLIGSELWHYMGYDGVFIAYSWPATPRGLAYLADMDTARLASRNIRIFLEYLSETTDVENIHIIGYSMGTRVTTYALQDLALINTDKSNKEIRKKVRLGNVILLGSDLDRGVFAGFMLDGIQNVSRSINIYMSATDSALSASHWLFERYRLGEAWNNHKPSKILTDYLDKNPNLRFIDVTNATGSDEGNGHHYFESSPWVSGDLLLSLMYGFTPEQRGLVKDEYNMWHFKKGHLERLKKSLGKMDPKLLDVNK